MSSLRQPLICLTPRVSGVGGMVSFRKKLTAGLESRGVRVTNDLEDETYDAVLVIGGTRQLAGLWRAKRHGVPIVQRLNGMNWMHRRLKIGLRHYMFAEYGNLVLNLIRSRLATHIVYQSIFARDWWERVQGPAPVPNRVIYNSVDLNIYHPDGPHQHPGDRYRLLLVEGSLGGGYEMGLKYAIRLTQLLITNHQIPLELMVVGKVSSEIQALSDDQAQFPINWVGQVPQESIPEIDRSAHLLYSADLNAACPNSVIEALACGLPVIAFETGALPELVTSEAGRIVPYGGDPWRLDPPNIPGLAQAAADLLPAIKTYRPAARALAAEKFGLDEMVEGYLKVLYAP